MKETQIKRDIVVVGASAGGVEALSSLVAGLPQHFPAAILVVVHLPPDHSSALASILARAGPLPASPAMEGEDLNPSQIYVAVPDHHLLLLDHHIHLSHGARENRYRPAIDPLFRSAARWYGPRVIGVVLSGTLDDGSAGLLTIKRRGGVAVVQDPDDAQHGEMPRSAMESVKVDYVVSAAEMASLLNRLTREPVKITEEEPVSNDIDNEIGSADIVLEPMEKGVRPGEPSQFACPECGGVLWQVRDGELIRYRCRVGHAYGVESLMQEQSTALEQALWA